MAKKNLKALSDPTETPAQPAKRTRVKEEIFIARETDAGDYSPLRSEVETDATLSVLRFADTAAALKHIKDKQLEGTFYLMGLKRSVTSKVEQVKKLTLT